MSSSSCTMLTAVLITLGLQVRLQAQCELQEIMLSAVDDYHIALNGDRLAIGDTESSSLFSTGPGMVSVYDRGPNGNFALSVILTASDGSTGDDFGTEVAVHDDMIAVGAPRQGSGLTGAVYIYERVAGVWTETAKIKNSSAWLFGMQVALDDNSSGIPTLAVAGNGTIYIYEQGSGGGWSLKFSTQHPAFDIAISGDVVATTDPLDDTLGTNFGSVRLIERGPFDLWIINPTDLVASDAASGMQLGSDVDIDGDRIVVGTEALAAYVFERQGTSWIETAKITSSMANFGNLVALSGDSVLIGDDAVVLGGISVEQYVLEGGNWNLFWSFNDALSGLVYDGTTAVTRSTTSAKIYNVPEPDWTGAVTQSVSSISAAVGGAVDFDIDMGPSFASNFYLLLGSFSGTEPGISVGGITVPLNPDDYFDLGLLSPNQAPYINSLALLDANGQATAQISVPTGLAVQDSLVIHHAVVILEPTYLTPVFSSDALSLCITP